MRSNPTKNIEQCGFKSIQSPIKDSITDRGSKFIGYVYPLTSEEDIHHLISQIKSRYPDATHHCYAYRVGHNPVIEFSSDDGEPAGSAGLPMLNSLRSEDLINTLAVVVRYYGGTNLGKSGLIKAYSGVIRVCIAKSDRVLLTPSVVVQISYPYDMSKPIDSILTRYKAQVIESNYAESIQISVSVSLDVHEECMHTLSEMEWQKVFYSVLGHSLVLSGKVI